MCKVSQGDPGRDQRSLGTSGHVAGGASEKQEKGQGHATEERLARTRLGGGLGVYRSKGRWWAVNKCVVNMQGVDGGWPREPKGLIPGKGGGALPVLQRKHVSHSALGLSLAALSAGAAP